MSSYPLSMTKVAFPNREAPRSIAEKVTSLTEVKSVPDKPRSFELMSVRLHDIAVVNVHDRLIRNPVAEWIIRSPPDFCLVAF